MAKKIKRGAKKHQSLTEVEAVEKELPDSAPVETLETELPKAAAEVVPKRSPKQFLKWALAHKKLSIPAAVLFVLLLITAIPATRYVLPGLFVKKDLSFILQDTSGDSRISEADVEIDGKLFMSDQNGVVNAKSIRPGSKKVTINKLFYKTFSQKISVSLFSNKQHTFKVESTGRRAKVTVKNRLSGNVLSGVFVKTEGGSQAKTGTDGTAILVLPSNKSEVKGTISGDTIVSADIVIKAVQDDSTNLYQATPSGRIYFLSKASGKVDVVKTNLDGSDRQVVLAGTGRENEYETVLLASKDWKYLALKSRREGELAKLYLIETDTDKLTTMDEGNAYFDLTGWNGSSFVYLVNRNNYTSWQAKRQALKSYNAATKQLLTLEETRGEGVNDYDYAYEYFQSVFVMDGQIVLVKRWQASYYYGARLADKKMSVYVVKSDGSGKKALHEWQAGYNSYLDTQYVGPSEAVYYVTLDGGNKSEWEYDSGVVKEVKNGEYDRNKNYPTYLESPNGKNNFWADARDGKNSLFIGDAKAENSKQIAVLSEYTAYGWFTDDYLLVSKNGSELYIMGRDGIKPGDVPTKVSDYHKSYSIYGYGKGYGGL